MNVTKTELIANAVRGDRARTVFSDRTAQHPMETLRKSSTAHDPQTTEDAP